VLNNSGLGFARRRVNSWAGRHLGRQRVRPHGELLNRGCSTIHRPS